MNGWFLNRYCGIGNLLREHFGGILDRYLLCRQVQNEKNKFGQSPLGDAGTG
jgi:hypothetical protein